MFRLQSEQYTSAITEKKKTTEKSTDCWAESTVNNHAAWDENGEMRKKWSGDL